MNQLSLFDSARPQAEKRPPNLAFVRKHLHAVLKLARNAETLPWSMAEAKSWESFFPELTALLPPEEGKELNAAFRQEMDRLKAA